MEVVVGEALLTIELLLTVKITSRSPLNSSKPPSRLQEIDSRAMPKRAMMLCFKCVILFIFVCFFLLNFLSGN